jgi:membrane associated rhomboid family serine protease
MLALPSLVVPETTTGGRISVAAHLGGLAAGVALGIVMHAKRERGTGAAPS